MIFLVCLVSLPGKTKVSHYPAPQTDVSVESGRTVSHPALVIYGVMDLEAFEPLILGFQAIFPGVAVSYHELISTELYERFLKQADAGSGDSPDLLISSAMDLQLKLVNDGYALPHGSAAVHRMPRWAVWRNEAFGFSFEPAVIVYNKALVPDEEIPRTRAELVRLLRAGRERYFGKVASYDPERSGLGFLFLTQDAEQSHAIWDLVRALGASAVKLFSTTGALLERIASGEVLIGYNVLGSYALARAQEDSAIDVVLPQDYVLVMSRIAVVPKTTSRPALARLFLGFLLGERGQRILARASHLHAIHPGVTGKTTADALQALAGDSLRPIVLGSGLLVYLDQAKHRNFLRRWEMALSGR